MHQKAMKPLNYLINVAVAFCLVQLSVGFNPLDYTKPSKEVGKLLRSKKLPGYPHEYGFGYYYQGDILLRRPKGNRLAIIEPLNFDIWPNATVPYEIEANFTAGETQTLMQAFEQFENSTCVRFVPHTDELEYVTIKNNPNGCYANVGRNPDAEDNLVNLQTPECMRILGTPVHELMHSLGFLHTQRRPDRDHYVRFFPQNLAPKHRTPEYISANHAIFNGTGTTYGLPYDYVSVMHYSRFADAATMFAPVLIKKFDLSAELGNENGLSDGDVAQVNARYCQDD